jgi:ribonuclease P/MRP protein subunit RPP40
MPTVVEINLRLPSMLHGKKGFERIAWAFKNVLNHTVAWLFYDLATEASGISNGTEPSLLFSCHFAIHSLTIH